MDVISKEYDRRQLKLMYECLLSFQNKQIRLSELIGSLEFLLSAMESINKNLENKFLNEIATIDLINSLEIIKETEDKNLQFNKKESYELVDKTVVNLKKMILDLLTNYLKKPDLKIEESAIAVDARWLICSNCNDAWESVSYDAMVECPKCDQVCHNPRYKKLKK